MAAWSKRLQSSLARGLPTLPQQGRPTLRQGQSGFSRLPVAHVMPQPSRITQPMGPMRSIIPRLPPSPRIPPPQPMPLPPIDQEYRPTGTVVPRQPPPINQFGGTVVPRGMQALFQRIAEQRAREREAREREARAMALENLSSEGPLYLYRGGIADLLRYYRR